MNAVVTPRMIWCLSWFQRITLLTVLLLSFLPAAVWSGALTPVLAENVFNQSLPIPTFDSKNLSTLFAGTRPPLSSGGADGSWLTNDGLFSFDPSKIRNSIVRAALDAPSVEKSNYTQSKLDKTGYLYNGRSYGAGSGAGMTDASLGSVRPQWYSYEEVGIYANFSCMRNESSAFNIAGDSYSGYYLYVPNGTLQNGQPFAQPQQALLFGYSKYDIFGWGVSFDELTERLLLSMARVSDQDFDPWDFKPLHNVQCHWNIGCKAFDVTVNNTNTSISVSPQTENTQCPAYVDWVMATMVNWLWDFSVTDSAYGGSQIGQALRLNINTLELLLGSLNDEIVFRGVQDAMNSIVDNILIHLLSTRYVSGAEDSTLLVEARWAVTAIVLGDWKYLATVIAINSVIAVVYIFEFVRTHNWKGISPLDLLNLGGIIISTGKGTSSESQSKYMAMTSKEPKYDRLHLRIGRDDGTEFPPLVLDDGAMAELVLLQDNDLRNTYSSGMR